jgi:hypothetical protein
MTTHDPRTTSSATRAAALALVTGLCIAITGCARTTIENTLETNYDAADPGAQVNFWHTLPERSAVANDEGLHGLFILADGSDPHTAYDARVADARARGWVGSSWNEPAGLAMQRGTLAAAVARIVELRGGVMYSLFPGPRYATRELISRGMIPPGSSENQAITGLEYLGVIGRAQDVITMREAQQAAKDAAQPAPTPPDAAPAPAAEPAAAPAPAEPPASAPATAPAP